MDEKHGAVTATQAMERDARFRMMVMSAVHRAMEQHGAIDPERAERSAHDIATRAAITVLQEVYEGDAELSRLRIERDHYKRFALDTAALKPLSPIYVSREAAQLAEIKGDR